MGLTADEKALLEQLTAKANEPDAPEYEVEIFSGDKGARVPLSKAAAWLHKEFGIGDPPAPAQGQGEKDKGAPKPLGLFRGGRAGPGKAAAGQGQGDQGQTG